MTNNTKHPDTKTPGKESKTGSDNQAQQGEKSNSSTSNRGLDATDDLRKVSNTNSKSARSNDDDTDNDAATGRRQNTNSDSTPKVDRSGSGTGNSSGSTDKGKPTEKNKSH